MSANLEQVLVEKIHALPQNKQAQVLEYVEELAAEPSISSGAVASDDEAKAKHAARMRLVGIGQSKSGNVSERVDEILAEGINKREGWSLP